MYALAQLEVSWWPSVTPPPLSDRCHRWFPTDDNNKDDINREGVQSVVHNSWEDEEKYVSKPHQEAHHWEMVPMIVKLQFVRAESTRLSRGKCCFPLVIISNRTKCARLEYHKCFTEPKQTCGDEMRLLATLHQLISESTNCSLAFPFLSLLQSLTSHTGTLFRFPVQLPHLAPLWQSAICSSVGPPRHWCVIWQWTWMRTHSIVLHCQRKGDFCQWKWIRAECLAYSYIKESERDTLVLQSLIKHDEGKWAHLHLNNNTWQDATEKPWFR